ncbi:MAG: dihydrolipoyl dehydrogenase [Candidatus Micrarchaeota archaeon]
MVVGEVAIEKQVVVIGGGPGGYVCAIRLSQEGKKVMLVEKDPQGMGGICLNHGCIPSKALIHVSNLVDAEKHLENLGISSSGYVVDVNKLQDWKTSVVTTLRKGVEDLVKRNGIELVFGEAHFESSRRLGVSGNHDVAAIEFQQAVIATGSVPVQLKQLPFDGKRIISSTECLQLREVPKEFIVVGSGYINIEEATMYAKLGSKVKIIEREASILPGLEKEVVYEAEKRVRELGIEVYTSTNVLGWKEQNGKAVVIAESAGKNMEIAGDKVLVAVGRNPNTESLTLNNTKVELDEKGFIKVNEKFLTTDQRIYAIGDVIGGAMLAHKAFMEGRVAGEIIAGKETEFKNKAIPAVVFCDPEIAYVGMSEKDAGMKNLKVKVSKFPFKALGRAHTMDSIDGFVKLIADFETNVLLGGSVVGTGASDLISEITLAVEMGLRLDDLALTIHPHPTLPEAIEEAAELAMGKAIHFYSKKF